MFDQKGGASIQDTANTVRIIIFRFDDGKIKIKNGSNLIKNNWQILNYFDFFRYCKPSFNRLCIENWKIDFFWWVKLWSPKFP